MRTVFIFFLLSLVSFACGNNAYDITPHGINHYKQTFLSLANHLLANLTIAVASVFSNEMIRVEKSMSSKSEIKPTL